MYSCSVVTEYNSDLSCHYKVELSYENLVTSGPDPHPPPIADDESDDEDDDDVPRVRAAYTSPPHFHKQTYFFFLLIIHFVSCTSGGPLCLAGQGLGDQSIPNHSQAFPQRGREEIWFGSDQRGFAARYRKKVNGYNIPPNY